MPDSVKASHILIPFFGARPSGVEPTKSEADAKIQAESILKKVKADRSKFSELAKELSADKSNSEDGGNLGWFNYNKMVPEFRDFCFSGKKGDIGIAKTAFGFHIIKIDDQKNKQKAIKLATLSRKIIASEDTENTIFQNAETLALELANGKNINEIAKDKNLKVKPAVGLKTLDENVPGAGNQRQIISWAHDKDTDIGDYKRFDIDGGYIVAVLTNITKKGLLPVDKAISKVRPIVMNEKKADLIKDKMSEASLSDIATTNKQTIKDFSGVSLKAPTISGVGNEPKNSRSYG